ncbi:MAG TPA: hypothetical protein VF261_01770 [Candidatus Saccharimonadales bacterium]
MSEDTAQELMDMYDKWDNRERRRNFISRMEHKLDSKERRSTRLFRR